MATVSRIAPDRVLAFSLLQSDDTEQGDERPFRIPPRRRLRFRLAAGVALGLATLLSVFTVLMSWVINLSIDAAIDQRLLLASTMARAVDSQVAHALRQMSVLSVQVAWEPQDDEPSVEQRALEFLFPVSGAFGNLAVVNRRGGVVWRRDSTDDTLITYAPPLGVTAVETGSTTLDIVSAAAEVRPIAIAAIPLVNTRGDSVAALVGVLDTPNVMPDLALLSQRDAELRFALVDQRGNDLLSSQMFAPVKSHLDALAEAVRHGEARAVLHDVEGEPTRVVAFAPFQQLPGGVIVEEPADIVLTIPRQLQRIGIFVGSTALLLLSLGAFWYARRITGPLDELAEAARTIAEGSLDHPVRSYSNDEIGLVARSFDDMRRRIKATIEEKTRWGSELERQVKERTEAVRQLLEKVISAQEEERKRVARDLHDGLVQDLAALLVTMETLESNQPIGEEQASLLRRVKVGAEEALQEVRRLLLDLRPSALDDLGLAPAVRWYVETRCGNLGVQFAVSVQGQERRLPPLVETALFRIVQEAVNNSCRHAEPRSVRVCLDFRGSVVVATMDDDGQGFDPALLSSGNHREALGLAGMRERALLVGGTADIRSSPGQGTRIVVSIPVEEDKLGAS